MAGGIETGSLISSNSIILDIYEDGGKQTNKQIPWLYERIIFNTISLTVSENYFYLPINYLYTCIRLKYFEFE